MQRLTQEAIQKVLHAPQRAPAVTIYMPTHRSSTAPHLSEDHIRFKNLVHKAIEILKTREDSKQFIRFLESKYEQLIEDKTFWEKQTESLLVCARPSEFYTFSLPTDCEEYVAVDKRFHLAPVYALLADEIQFYLLVLAQHNPKLYLGDSYELWPVEAELPATIEDALRIDELHQKSIQFHSGASNGRSMFHGHGGAKDITNENRLRFFRIIDHIVSNLSDTSLPLVLAGIDNEVMEYESISRYPHIQNNFINGSHTRTPMPELHAQARRIIQEEIIAARHQRIIERFARLAGENDGLVATDPAAVKDAAEKGRVDMLAIGMSRQTRDTVRDSNSPVTKLTFEKQLDSTSIDYIAQLVWSQSGNIVNLEETQMPNQIPIFAILRY